jgi:class 3 adenylate cyclase
LPLVGHRRRLLDGIAALGTSARVAAATARTDDVAPRSDAERRQLTVMFCDLVASTPLSSQTRVKIGGDRSNPTT